MAEIKHQIGQFTNEWPTYGIVYDWIDLIEDDELREVVNKNCLILSTTRAYDKLSAVFNDMIAHGSGNILPPPDKYTKGMEGRSSTDMWLRFTHTSLKRLKLKPKEVRPKQLFLPMIKDDIVREFMQSIQETGIPHYCFTLRGALSIYWMIYRNSYPELHLIREAVLKNKIETISV